MSKNNKRTATVRTTEYCRLGYLEGEDFKRILGREATEWIYQRFNFMK